MKQLTYFLFLFLLFVNTSVKGLNKIPGDYIGNFYDQSGKEYWTFGLQPDFLIYDCQFWDYEKITSKENTLSLWLKNNGSSKRLDIVKSDSINFDLIEGGKIIHCSKKAHVIKRVAKNNPFSMDTGTVVIRGYIKNAKKYFKTDSKIEFIFCNEAIHNTKSEFADIDSLGRFDVPIKVMHAASCLIRYRNFLKEIFVSPGDQLFISTDAYNFKELDFMGTHADVCYDIIKITEADQKIESAIQRNSSYRKAPTEFKSYRDTIKQKQGNLLQNYLKNNSCSEAFKIWYTKYIEINYYTELMRYTWNRFDKNSENRMAPYDSYFSFIDSINQNDSQSNIPYKYIFFTSELYNKLSRRDSLPMHTDQYKVLYLNKKNEFKNKYPNLTEDEIQVEVQKFEVKKDRDIILSKNSYSRFRDLRLARILINCIQWRQYEVIDYAYDLIKTEIRYQPYLNTITEYYQDFKKKEDAFKNTPISVMKSSGKGEELLKEIVEKHKERVIVLDFWFTGCSACRRDFKQIHLFKKDLVSEDVDFIYLCYSSTENNWKDVIKEFNIKGDHYLLTSDQVSSLSNMFDLSSAPRYVLINKEGRVVNSNFRPPMDVNGYLTALRENLKK